MLDFWTIFAIFALSITGGAITGAVSLILGGAGSVRVLAQRLETLEGRQDDTSTRLTKEVRRRAGDIAADARRTHASDADVTADALRVLKDQETGETYHGGSKRGKRPSVVTRSNHGVRNR